MPEATALGDSGSIPAGRRTAGVVIATRNRPEPLRRCLDSFLIQTRSVERVLIVDSSDTDATRSLISEFQDRIAGLEWIRSPFASAARQRNLGTSRLDTDIVIFLDDDVVLDPSFVAEIMNVFEDSTRSATPAGVSGTMINHAYTDPKGLNRLLLGLCIGQLRGSYAGKIIGPAVNFLSEDRPDTIQPVEWLPSGCCAYDRCTFMEERFAEFDGYSFAEDVHLSARVGQRHLLLNTTRARLYHEDLGHRTHRDWSAIGESQVLNRHLILSAVLGRRGASYMLRLFAYEMLYCPIAYLAAGRSAERRQIVRRLIAGKWRGFRHLWSAVQ